jgi:hypothetical protein
MLWTVSFRDPVLWVDIVTSTSQVPASGMLLLLSKVKVNLSLCCFLNWAPCHEGVLGEQRYSSTHSWTSALEGGEWSASRPGRFIPRERTPGIHWIGGWVGPRDVLDGVVKRRIPSPAGNRTLIPQSSAPNLELYRLSYHGSLMQKRKKYEVWVAPVA